MSDDVSDLGRQAEPRQLVTLTKCATLQEADEIRCRLETERIQCVLPDEAMLQNVAWEVNAYGYIRVQVSARDLNDARAILDAFDQARSEVDDGTAQGRLDSPLASWLRVTMFLLPLATIPGLWAFVVARGGFIRQGCNRKAREATWCFVSGAVLVVTALFVFVAAR